MQTQAFAFEDPKHTTAWRVVDSEDDKTFFYNVITGESQWEPPVEMAWEEVEKDDQKFWFNKISGESTWEAPESMSWELHNGDL